MLPCERAGARGGDVVHVGRRGAHVGVDGVLRAAGAAGGVRALGRAFKPPTLHRPFALYRRSSSPKALTRQARNQPHPPKLIWLTGVRPWCEARVVFKMYQVTGLLKLSHHAQVCGARVAGHAADTRAAARGGHDSRHHLRAAGSGQGLLLPAHGALAPGRA